MQSNATDASKRCWCNQRLQMHSNATDATNHYRCIQALLMQP
jgi:hypothetical protein